MVDCQMTVGKEYSMYAKWGGWREYIGKNNPLTNIRSSYSKETT